jgi:HD superfamily phosphohydrolase YqeK
LSKRDQQETAERLQACQGALAHLATKDEAAVRRYDDDDEDRWLFPYGKPYALDVEKGLNSKSIRRMEKTQVIISPLNAHARNRYVHTFEVTANARIIARILGLNEDLAAAGSWLHDIGHTPLGHQGERFLNSLPGVSFRHERFGCILAQRIERKTNGLNLTKQTLQCIRYHSRGKGDPKTMGILPEADVVMLADKISYTFADFADIFSRQAVAETGIQAGAFPGLVDQVRWFGSNGRERIQTAITALCLESAERGQISFSESEAAQRFVELKKLMYEVYPRVYPRDNFPYLRAVYEALAEAVPDADTTVLFAMLEDADILRLINLTYGGQRLRRESLTGTAVADALPYIVNVKFDLADPDIDW